MKFALASSRYKAGLVGLVAVAMVVPLASCSSSSKSAGGGSVSGGSAPTKNCTVRTLMVSNITGGGSANGSSAKIATQLADDYVNSHGGVNGCKLESDFKDDGSDYSKVLPLTQTALGSRKYAMVNASDYGGVSVAPLLTRQGILGVFSNGTGGIFSQSKTPTIFDACTPLSGAAVVMSKYLATQKHFSHIAIVTDNTAVGTSVIAGAQAAANSNGVTIIPEQVDLSTVDMTPVVQRTRAANPDVVLVDLFGTAAGSFFRALKASGWNIPKYGAFTTFATDLASLIPADDFAGLISGGPASATAPAVTPALSNLISSLKANGGSIKNALLLYAQNYDTIILFAWAANATHSTDGKTLANYLETHGDTPVPGLTQAVSSGYSASNHEWHPKNGLGIADQDKLVDGQYQHRIALVDA